MKKSYELFQLRKLRKFEEALEIINNADANDLQDLWFRKACAWVLYDLVKACFQGNDLERARKHIDSFESLNIPEDDLAHQKFAYYKSRLDSNYQKAYSASRKGNHRLAYQLYIKCETDVSKEGLPKLQESIAWEIWHLIKAMASTGKTDQCLLDELLKTWVQLRFPLHPANIHSLIMQQLLRLPAKYKNLLDWKPLFDYYKVPESFTEGDWKPFITHGGKKVMSFAEKLVYALARTTIEKARYYSQKEIKKVRQRLEEIEKITKKFSWLLYYKGKLMLLENEDKRTIRELFIPFIEKMAFEFWVWDLLSETFSNKEAEKKIACLCKSLSCRGKDDYKIKVRLKLAGVLAFRKEYVAARYELERYQAVVARNGWRKHLDADFLIHEDWYAATRIPQNYQQTAFYTQHIPLAETIVYGADSSWKVAIIERVNRKDKRVHYIIGKEEAGEFLSLPFRKFRFHAGDVVELKVMDTGKVTNVRKTKKLPDAAIWKTFHGRYHSFRLQKYGLVKDVFVPAYLVQIANLTDNSEVFGIAIRSLDRKKNKYGWKALKILDE